MPAPTRFLIGAPGYLPEPLFLHVFDVGEAAAEMEWMPDRASALRFASRDAAERFGAVHRLGAIDVSEHAAADLACAAHHISGRLAAVT